MGIPFRIVNLIISDVSLLLGSCSASDNQPPLSKKAKKAALKQAQHAQVSTGSHSSSVAVDFNDQAALNRRAERFQREHELERMKQLRVSKSRAIPSSVSHANGYLYENGRAASVFSNGNSTDEPEADPVSRLDVASYTRWLIVDFC